ncbi:MAG: hypothetical protein R3F07_02740 [Opitutaceae bacterium]
MRSHHSGDSRRGSVLLVTMILTLGLAIFLGSYVKMAMGSYQLSTRSFYSNSCLNLAEAGLEEALFALNNSDWTGWTANSGHMNRTISGINLGSGNTGQIRVRVFDYATDPSPRIVSEGLANLNSGPALRKQVEITVSRKSFFANGIVAKDTVEFKGGNAYVDSFDSSDPAASTGGLYDFAKRKDNGSVGSVLVTSDAVSISNAEIWGYVATGGSAPTVGSNGKIHGADTPSGVDVDTNRIRTDFTASFDSVTAPGSFTAIYTNVSGNITLGTLGSATTIKATSISNNNGQVTQFAGDVTLVVSGDIDIKGDFVVGATSSLTVYVAGDVDIGGNGVMNLTGLSEKLILYGTNPTSQTIKLHGNGAAHAAIFAPNADLELKGGGSSGVFVGAAVVKTAFINGNFEFHYDEALSKLGSSGVYTVGGWRELNGAAQLVSL